MGNITGDITNDVTGNKTGDVTDGRLIEFAVKALIIKNGKFLALHKAAVPSPRYELPGGRMCFGETAEETVVREVLEETGLPVKPLRLLDTWNYLTETKQITGIIYLCAVVDTDMMVNAGADTVVVTLSEEHDHYEWLAAESYTASPSESRSDARYGSRSTSQYSSPSDTQFGSLADSLAKMNRLFAPQMSQWDWPALLALSALSATLTPPVSTAAVSATTPAIPAIIPVTDKNKQNWAALCAALWPHHTTDEMLTEWAEGACDNEYLYMLDGEAVAFISLSLRRDYVEGTASRPVGYVEGIYVKPAHRKKGIARALVAFAGEWSRAEGCKELASDCALENTESRQFHRRVGFTEANTIVCFTMDIAPTA